MLLLSAAQYMFNRAWEIVEENWHAYLALNAIFYGLVIAGMLVAGFIPAIQADMLAKADDSMTTGSLWLLGKGFDAGQSFRLLMVMYFGNVLGAGFGAISFPSFLMPFSGLAMGAYHAIQWGLLFSPANESIRPAMIMHSLELLIEGQGYILAMLGAYIHGRAVLWPQTVGLTSRWKGYVEGVRQTGTLYLLIMIVFAIAALYGGLEVAVLSLLLPK